METKLKSKTREVIISAEGPTVLIGERINPTGKRKMAEALKVGDFEIIRREALAQVQAGADILDVNVGVGLAGQEEANLLSQAVRAIMEVVDVPLCLDCINPQALEAAIKVCGGKPLINSVSGDERSLEEILPLVKEYGTAVIGLTMDGKHVPGDADGRFRIACKILERATDLGIPREDVLIDCLVQSVGVNTKAGVITIDTIRKVKAQFGVNLTLGANNVSFGLPDRGLLGRVFLTIAITAGVTCPIVDVAEVSPTVAAADLLLGRDKNAKRYIADYRQRCQAI